MLTKSLLSQIVMALFLKEFDEETANKAVEIINKDVISCTETELKKLSKVYDKEIRLIDEMEDEDWYFKRNIDFNKEHMFYALLCMICENPKYAINRLLIANCTQHDPTQDQLNQGVSNPDCWEDIKELISFNEIPSWREMKERAEKITELLHKEGFKSCLIGGAPYFMSTLERVLINSGIQPLYAFSVRESRDEHLSDGSVRKVSVFKHKGFMKAEFC